MKKFICLIFVVLITLSALCVSVSAETANEEYDSYVNEFMSQYTYVLKTGEEKVYEYGLEVAYEHYADNDSENPEYIVLLVSCNGNGDKYYYEINGYYFWGYLDDQYEGKPSYLVFDTNTKKVCWYDEALENNFDKYFEFITDSGYKSISRIGDVNKDKELNIKDATEIQKYIAGVEACFNSSSDKISGFTEKMHGDWIRTYSDFNRDGKTNIKDATEIQKYIAGITE